MGIFNENAPLYWAAGLPVIPLKKWDANTKGAGKAPMLGEWQNYGSVAPSAAVRDHWAHSFPDNNIGLPFGPASGLCAIDIDTEDPELITLIEECLPACPWVRVGKKGKGLVFKWQGQKNFKINGTKDASGQSRPIVEFLGLGNQMVMPPSIHPDTGKPYVATTNLWEVLEKIQPMPLDIENLLREALGDSGYTLSHQGRSKPTEVVPAGVRDNMMVARAGYYSRAIRGLDGKAEFTLAEAIEHIHHWVSEYTASVSGDDMDPEKGVTKLLEFLLKDIEKGKTLPTGWDTGLTESQLGHPTIQALVEKNRVQRWTYTKAKAWIEGQVASNVSGDDDFILDRVDEIIQLVAADENFTRSHFMSLRPHLERAAGDASPGKVALVAAFDAARRGDMDQDSSHAEIAQSVIEELSRKGEVRWAQGGFWQWDGACFGVLLDDEVFNEVVQIKNNKLVLRHNDYVSLVKTVGKLSSRELIEVPEGGVNFANGFLDLNGDLQDHDPKYGQTFTMPFNYIPARANEAHKWLEFLEMSWGNDLDYEDKVKALQEAFAATMFGIATNYQRAFLIHGVPHSGKTVLLDVLEAMMPPVGLSSLSPEQWGNDNAKSELVGKKLNICGELPESGLIPGKEFKEITEGALIHARKLYQDGFVFRPYAANWFASNHLPRSKDSSKGFSRRWQIFEFTRVVPVSERVQNFSEILIADEREAIAAWAVLGLKRLLAQGDYTQPASHLVRINHILRGNNSVAAFLQDSTKVRPCAEKDVSVDAVEAHAQYKSFMRNASLGPAYGSEQFRQILGDLGYETTIMDADGGGTQYRIQGLKMAPGVGLD